MMSLTKIRKPQSKDFLAFGMAMANPNAILKYSAIQKCSTRTQTSVHSLTAVTAHLRLKNACIECSMSRNF